MPRGHPPPELFCWLAELRCYHQFAAHSCRCSQVVLCMQLFGGPAPALTLGMLHAGPAAKPDKQEPAAAAPAGKAATGAPDVPAASQAAEEKAANAPGESWRGTLPFSEQFHCMLASSDSGDSLSALAISLVDSCCIFPAELS